ncbi:MAG: hypothetical protein H3C45_12015, partial [Bacteroidia bacterium]|nr:hypothetical protein [Bacteroidia bacterium]
MSDTAGNLLFYTDGDTIWDKNHQPMPNGIGLMGCPLYGSSAQAALIVPQPGHDSLYYIFTTDCWENFGAFGLRYSIINMKLNGGLGDITSMKNILLHTPITEGLTATYNCDETGVWIMSHEYNSNNYMCYFLDTNGINLIPVISSIGSVYNDYFCYMRFSPNGKFLASSFSSSSVSGELFKFDLVNGLLYDIISIPLFSGDYGTCFSPDNSKLFFTLGGADVYQFDISAYNQFDIVNSKNQIDTTDNFILGAISNGIDNKMYVAVVDEQKIGVIQSPNVYGSGSNMNLQGVMLSNKKSSLGLPDFIQ